MYKRQTLDILSRKALILEIVMGIIIIGIVFFFSHILIMPYKRVTQAISEVKDGFTDAVSYTHLCRGTACKGGSGSVL